MKDSGSGLRKRPQIVQTNEEWRKTLSDEQYRILREAGTERAFSGAFWDHDEYGIYSCAGCGADLFRSDDKFDSGTGWPSYTRPISRDQVGEVAEWSWMGRRIEVHCASCNGHLGHVFPDGPPPTGLRYCINSGALTFRPATPAVTGESEPD